MVGGVRRGMVDGSTPQFFILFSELGVDPILFVFKIDICHWSNS